MSGKGCRRPRCGPQWSIDEGRGMCCERIRERERWIGGRRHFRAEQPLLPSNLQLANTPQVLGFFEDQHQTHISPRLSQAAVQLGNQPLKTNASKSPPSPSLSKAASA
ncbi:hypothetical protein HaLaN_11526, partial [Haematococcus lacustris]